MATGVYIRAMLLWLQFMAIETLSGVLRTVYIEPRLGEVTARQLGVLAGCCIFITLVVKQYRWLRIPFAENWQIGFFWSLLTVGFEIALGKGVMRLSWSRILSDYDVLQGGLMGAGLLCMAVAPALANRLQAHQE
jgi:hypothetical protein